jgi:two-component system cell cycle sensor histidine kinase/response regulator CckA
MVIRIQLLKTIVSAFLILLTLFPVLAGPQIKRKQVLIIHSYHSGLSWTDSLMNGIREVFDRSGQDIQMSAEYLDARRAVTPERKRMIQAFIVSKSRGTTPDLVIVSDNAAFNFILEYRERLFPGVPVVFCGVNDFRPAMITNHRGFTGVAEEASVVETVELALRLHPGTKNIIVIGRKSVAADKYNRDAFVASLPDLPSGIWVVFWDDFSNTELKTKLQKLSRDSVVFLNGLITDDSGQQLMYGESTKWVSNYSPVPLYSLWEVYLGYGIVGGRLISAFRQGELAAELALRILDGESADTIPVVGAKSANNYLFDYRQLARFGISLSELPQGSIVINRPDSFYDRHKYIVWAAVFVVAVLSGFVIFLSISTIRRRRAEESLRQANLVVENSPAILFRWKVSEGWPVEYVSNNVTRFGYSVEELLSGSVLYTQIVHAGDLERVKSEVWEHSASGEDQFKQEYRILTKSGDVRWVEDHTVIEREPGSQVTHYQGVVIDITERKNAQEALHVKTDELDRIFNLSPDLLCIADLNGRFVRLNPVWEQTLGYPLNELEGRMFMDFVHPDDIATTRRAIDDLTEGEDVIDFVNRYRHRDGTYRWIEWRSTPYQRTLIYAAARDVTERISNEIAEARLKEQLFHAQKMETVGLLAGGVAHDFNNLLTPILGYSELLMLAFPEGDKNRQKLEQINQAASLARDLTKRLLAFSRKQMLELDVVNVGDIIHGFEQVVHRTIRENIQIEIFIAPSLGMVRADKGQIEQVLLNLAVNAQDAMPEGGVLIIEAKNTDLDESYTSSHLEVTPGPYVMLSVSDTGMGIDEETQEHIFEPFYTTKELGRGTGLGLATVYGIVKQHGGSISVYSVKNKGSTFKIFLPRATEEATKVEKQEPQPSNIEHGSETVLVMEDNETVRSLTCGMLEGLGYQVLAADNVGSCIELIGMYTGPIHLLLTDVVMPEKNGKELYELLQRDRPELNVLYMSGYAGDVIGHHGILDEGINFLQKPFTLAALSQKVRRALES